MATYKIIELVGTSYISWDDAAKKAVETARKTLNDLRIGEVTKLDMRVEDDGRILYRSRLSLSFKVHDFGKYAESLGAKLYAEEPE